MGEVGVRMPAVAGQFYPGQPGRLAGTVDRLLDASPSVTPEGEVAGLIVPHAGYPYSGATAAAAYRLIAGRGFRRIVVLAPSHRELFAFASVLEAAFQTPLGTIPPESEFIRRLVEIDPIFRLSDAGHHGEHSLEVQLPFIQRVAPQASLVPIMLSETSPGSLERIGLALARAIQEMPALLVASSDLYHGEDEDECRRADRLTLDHVLRSDPVRYAEALLRNEVQACGAAPIGALLFAGRALGASAHLLAATNSNEATGSGGGYVVGYAAVALLRARASGAPEEEHGRRSAKPGAEAASDAPAARAPARGGAAAETASEDGAALSDEEKRELLRIARSALERAVLEAPPPDVSGASPGLMKPHAAFVTLRRCRQLRGCIGYAEPRRPLAYAVVELARAAAMEDPRFRPVEPEELAQISIEISVLSEPVPVCAPEEIEAGLDGVAVERGRHRGLLLPQVASEQGWDRWMLLEHCCLKAGLPGDAWKDPRTGILRFRAEVFGDGRPAGPAPVSPEAP